MFSGARLFASVVSWLVEMSTVASVDCAIFRPNIVPPWRVCFSGDDSWLATSRVSHLQYCVPKGDVCSSFGISAVVLF